MKEHLRKLEQMYMNAPVQELYKGINIQVKEGAAEISLPVDPKFFHAGNALHGSVYFRLLDDAAYFASNSLENEYFMLTASFHIDLFRPVTGGTLTAKGKVINRSRNVTLSESELFDDRNKLVAKGKGTFMRSQQELINVMGYEKDR